MYLIFFLFTFTFNSWTLQKNVKFGHLKNIILKLIKKKKTRRPSSLILINSKFCETIGFFHLSNPIVCRGKYGCSIGHPRLDNKILIEENVKRDKKKIDLKRNVTIYCDSKNKRDKKKRK